MTIAISISELRKNYQSFIALMEINLEIRAGEFFGLLGPNGAGKTTLINCMVGLAKASHGDVKIFGHSVRKNPLEAKKSIGFSPQEVNIERFFNIRRILEFQGGFYGMKPKESKSRAQELLEQFGLIEKAKVPFYKLSGGMQKRLLVARALMGRPNLLILDEPTAGVDVEQRHELWKYLRNLNRDGTTILLTTHYIDEAEALCERVGIINHGQIIELGSPATLIQKYCQAELCLRFSQDVKVSFEEIEEARVEGSTVKASAPTLGPTLERILAKALTQPGQRLLDLSVQQGSLEEVFLKVAGHSLKAEEVENNG